MNKRLFDHVDLALLTPVLILVILSLTTLSSINVSIFKSQVVFLVISLIAFLFFSQVDYKTIKLYGIPIYIFSVISLFFVLIIGIETRGAVRWVTLFGFTIQFSEILKPFLSISLAAFISQRTLSFRTFLLGSLFLLPILLLIFIQPDLGNALLYGAVALFTFIAIGFPFLWFGIEFMAILFAFPIFWHFLRGYQKQRVLTFLHPANDPLGTSYNAVQAIIAVGSGELIGKGLSEGTQSGLRFLPERHTDFIFATLSEGLGFIGAVAIIIAFGFLFYRIYVIFENSQDTFCKTFIASSFFILLLQFFVNVGMNIGLVPIVGITLPFVSYGGSSLLSNFIILGLLSSIATSRRDRRVLEIR